MVPEAGHPERDKQAIEQAWKVHAAQVDWTGKVDTKASFAFTIESATLGITVALSATNRIFASMPSGLPPFLYWAGIVALLCGMFCALMCVIPRLKSKDLLKTAEENFIYFGHARHWDPDRLVDAFKEHDMLPMITRQIVVMADVAWDKHKWVQRSMALGVVAGVCLGISGMMLSSVHH
ncbi:Pycsar system effector family protein [Sinomonas mesophila]|uniref:Pycsar system effector family protein n=1 Tax=Sinomonas mesophila TaxID=1531955 RepID=UPI000986931C|nr:Pycsar system effector family protein [Sinomonas mesophila]